MSLPHVYLKQNVLAEPLFNQWYAWPGLIAPASAAMFIANSHLKIMQSFVSAPQVHVAALKNPAMRGAPFIHYDANRVPEIKALIEKTSKEQAHKLELAAAIRTLTELLDNEATGFSLESLYAKVPDELRGYVELSYDVSNHPSIRFIEGLLYKSRYYDTSSQSISLSEVNNDDRPFVLSSPQLEDDGHLHLRTPFNNPALDELFKMRTAPQPIGYITELLGVNAADAERFNEFFTTEASPPTQRYTGENVRIRYFGHACLLFETKNVSILTDPVVSYAYPGSSERYSFADLPDAIDYVVITHTHQDHCMFETLLQLRHKIKHIIVPKNSGDGLVDPSLKLVLRTIGFENVSEIDELESIEVPGGFITGLPFLGEHADLNIRTKLAYLIKLAGKSVLCAADSNNIEPRLYQHIQQITGNVDIVFLGMECEGAPLSWLYGPLLTKPLARKMDQSRRLDGSDCRKGLELIDCLKPTQVYVYAMGQEPWLTYLTALQYTEQSKPIVESDKLVAACRERQLVADRLFGCREI
ncbi:MAG TPA: MBL fold metallo-hydrolase [Pyrinomonadaceae bacterium]|nr:MBL fold metallo-hydrolase [Pyrinomonadaceae bacterium]